ncbi:MAG: class I SAM-dependent methyltransferase [Planctomycetes bacterium]|nr:class I SAM-dependent methyltransferase [Planctomycetota bacterium]
MNSDLNQIWDKNRARDEDKREKLFPLIRLQTLLVKRRLRALIASREVRTVLDVGGGTGRYAIYLAEKGLDVTLVDPSEAMRVRAVNKAREKKLAINVADGEIADLAEFADGSKDLVLCIDAPLSFSYPEHEKALSELIRVAGKAVVIVTTSRLGTIPVALGWDLTREYVPEEIEDEFEPYIYAGGLLANGAMRWREELLDHVRELGLDSRDFGFLPEQIEEPLKAAGFEIAVSQGLGALSLHVEEEALESILDDEAARDKYLDLEDAYGTQPSVRGLGAPNILVIGIRDRE